MDFLDTLKVLDDAIDAHLSEDGTVIVKGVVFKVRGPLDRDIYTDETGSAHTGSLASTYSVQTNTIPDDPRHGYLSCRGELFRITDYDTPRDGRTVLILDKAHNIKDSSQFGPYPYPFQKVGNAVQVAGYPYVYPIIV